MPGLSNSRVALFAVFLLVAVVPACSRTPHNPIDDVLKNFAGNWKVVSLDRAGKKSDANAVKSMSVTVEGDKIRFEESSAPTVGKEGVTSREMRVEEYVLQVNPATGGDVDFVHANGENQTKARPGLYQFDGDKLKISLAAVGSPRPTQIAPGNDTTVWVLER